MVPRHVFLVCIYMHIYIGVENGNPFHYSCLENSMDRGAWCTTVHEVTELDTTEHTCTHMEAHVCVYTLICVFMYVFMCVCIHTYMLVCILMCGQSCPTRWHIYIYITFSVCVCIYIPAATFEREFEFTFN